MRNIPVNTSDLTFVAAAAPEPKTDPSGTQKTDRDGNPQSVVQVLVSAEGQDPEVIKVSTIDAGKVTALSPVTVDGLTAIAWEMNGRHGIAFTASAVKPASAAASKSSAA